MKSEDKSRDQKPNGCLVLIFFIMVLLLFCGIWSFSIYLQKTMLGIYNIEERIKFLERQSYDESKTTRKKEEQKIR